MEEQMRTDKEELIRDTLEIAEEIGCRGFVAKWMVDHEAVQEWPNPLERESEIRALWGKQWEASSPSLIKEVRKLTLEELTAYRSQLQGQLSDESNLHKIFDDYAALSAKRREMKRGRVKY